MGLGPVPAANKVLDRAGLTLAEIDVIELNEAFASQALACMKLLGIAADDSRVNAYGGAIAIGHPLGMSGARIALTAARQLVAGGGRHALVTMCIGLGQGIAMILELTDDRSEEHTSELQVTNAHLVCHLLLYTKNIKQ